MTEKECLAMVFGVLTCRPYLLGLPFVVNTDHSALRWLMTINDPSGRLMRWRLRLAEYDFIVKYRPGHTHCHADAASRVPTKAPVKEILDFDVPCFASETENQTSDEADDFEERIAETISGQNSPALPQSRNLPRVIDSEELADAQLCDPFCIKVRKRINDGERMAFE
eukprot:IDg592t1